MFAMFGVPARTIDRPRRLAGPEPSFWRGLALLGLVALIGLALSILIGAPAPIEQLTILGETP